MNLIQEIKEAKIIVILRNLSHEETFYTAEALQEAGIRFVEVTFSPCVPNDATVSVISTLCRRFPDMHIGAGTVLTTEQVAAAHTAGAEYIISPNISPPVIQETRRLNMLSMPGAMTPTEIAGAYQAGASIVKVFPSGSLGADYIHAVLAPLPQIPLAAVGGVNLENIREFFRAGVCCVGIGANIVDKNAIRAGNYRRISELAGQYLRAVRYSEDS